MVALTDLGFGSYLGSEGGLYPDGRNTRPLESDAAGLAIANSIQPLDANGNPDPNGKYGLISIGESNTSNTYAQFTINANADPSKKFSSRDCQGRTTHRSCCEVRRSK
jgi:hypothetical protein